MKRFILFLLVLTGEYLSTVTELLQMYGTSGPTIVVRRYELDLNGNYRNVLRRIKNSGDTSFVVVGSLATLPELFKQVIKWNFLNKCLHLVYVYLHLVLVV